MKQPKSHEYNVTNTHCLLTQYLKHNRVSCVAAARCDNETLQKTKEQTVAYKRKWREKVWSLKWKSTRSISRKLRTTDILPQRRFYYRIKTAASSKVSLVETDTNSSMPRSCTRELVHARKNVKRVLHILCNEELQVSLQWALCSNNNNKNHAHLVCNTHMDQVLLVVQEQKS